MRPLDKIEKYLKRFTSNIVESEHSRYFKLNGCTIRVSDHFATTSVCYISIIISINGGYIITNPKTAKVAIVKYDELKGVIKSLSIIPDVVNNTEIEGNQALNSKIKNLETQVNSYKSVVTTLKEKVNQFNLLSLQKYGIFNMPSLFTILYNFEKFIIDDWEFSFLISTNSMKHEFSSKQKEILKRLINKLIPINDSKIKVNHIYYVYDGVTWCTITFNYNMNKEHTLRRKIKNKYLFDYSSSNQYDIIDKDLFEIGLR